MFFKSLKTLLSIHSSILKVEFVFLKDYGKFKNAKVHNIRIPFSLPEDGEVLVNGKAILNVD